MRRVLIEWRGIRVYPYPAMLYLGLVAGVLGGTYGASLHGISPQRLLPPMLLLIAVALAGSRFSYIALHWDAYRHNLGRIWRRSDSGAAQYGGLVLAFLASLPLLSAYQVPMGSFWDAAIITILIGTIFTRFGCLLNGCCGGRPSEGSLTFYLPNDRGEWRRRIPTQLIEAATAAMLLAVSLAAWRRMPFEGALFLGNLAAYGLTRYWLQSLRETHDPGDDRLCRAFSIGLVAFSAGSFVSLLVMGMKLPWIGVPGLEVAVAAAGSALDPRYFLWIPLSVLAIVSLFHFTGCGCYTGLEINDLCYVELDGKPLYATTVVNENGTCDPLHPPPPSVCLALWTLTEESPPTAIPGGQAEDGRHGLFPGVYNIATLPPLPDPELDADHSPTTAQPGTLVLGAPGLLGFDAGGNRSMEVQGGFVEVGGSVDLNLPEFTIEALVFPTWDTNQLGRWYCVVEHSSPIGNKKFGFAIYAGPEGTGQILLNTPYRWQVWMGITTAGVTRFTQMKPVVNPKPLPLVEPNKVNYVAMTFDGSTVKLYSTHEGKLGNTDLNVDPLIALDEPIAPGVYAPNQGPQSLLIGMGRDLFAPFNPAGDPRYPFQGRIQDVAVYEAALKPERIFSHIAAAFENL